MTDRDQGLNPALALARDAARDRGATAIVVLPADLPWLDRATLDDMLDAAEAGWARRPEAPDTRFVALVPDRHGTGTNVLVLAPPDAIEFAFGADSRHEHANRARSAGAAYLELGGPLDVDLDTADDLVLVEGIAPETIDVV